MKHIKDNWFNRTFIKKDIYRKISFKKLKPKVVQVDIETEGGIYVDGVLVTQDTAIKVSGVQEALIREMGKTGNGYAKGELGIIVPQVSFDEMWLRKLKKKNNG